MIGPKFVGMLPPLWPPLWVWHVAAYSLVPVAASVLVMRSFVVDEKNGSNLGRRPDGLGCMSLGCLGYFLVIVGLVFSSGIRLVLFYFPALFASPFMGAAAIPLAIALFILREKRLALYGLLEIAGACATVLYTGIVQQPTAGARAAAILGAMYFVVRGLDNAKKGLLWSQLKGLFKTHGIYAATAGMFMVAASFTFVVLIASGRVPVPFALGWWGIPKPVSPEECGGFLVVCDTASWKLYEKMVAHVGVIDVLRRSLGPILVAMVCIVVIVATFFQAGRDKKKEDCDS